MSVAMETIQAVVFSLGKDRKEKDLYDNQVSRYELYDFRMLSVNDA